MTVTFDVGAHEYRADGRPLTSVTTILKAVGYYDQHVYTDPKHRQIGSAVHTVCQLIDDGRYDPAGTHEELRPFGEAYQRFARDTGFRGLFWERSYGCPRTLVGGTFDVIGTSGDDEFWMLDFKKGNVPDLCPVQIAAYESLVETGIPVNCTQVDIFKSIRAPLRKKALRLEASGKYTLVSRTKRDVPYDDPRWRKVWMAAVTQYHTLKEYNRPMFGSGDHAMRRT